MLSLQLLQRLSRPALAIVLGLSLIWTFALFIDAGAAGSDAAPVAGLQTPAALPMLPLPSAGASAAGAARLLNNDGQALTVEIAVPTPSFEPYSEGDFTCQQMQIPGFGQSDTPGAPALPVSGAMLGLPPSGQPSLQVVEADFYALPERYTLCPVAQPIPAQGADGQWLMQGYTRLPDAAAYAAAYAADRFQPAQAAVLAQVANIRSQRVAQIRFQPVQYNPLTGEVRLARRIRVTLRFNQAADSAATTRPAAQLIDEGNFESLLASSLLNYEQARSWRSQAAHPAARSDAARPLADERYKVMVKQDGLYRLSYADLQAAGLPVDTLDPRKLRLHSLEQEIALWVEGQDDGVFDSQDWLVFYGQGAHAKFTYERTYWLTYDQVTGLRMDVQDVTPDSAFPLAHSYTDTLHLEKDSNYQSARPSSDNQDHWYWDYIAASGNTKLNKRYNFTLSSVYTAPFTSTVRGMLRGYSANPLHATRIILNRRVVDDALWGAQNEYLFSRPVTYPLLISGSNAITVHLPMTQTFVGSTRIDQLYSNWFELQYQRQFVAVDGQLDFQSHAGEWTLEVRGFSTETLEVLDISQPQQPVRLLNTDVLATPAYRARFEQANGPARRYLLTTPEKWLKPLGIVLDTPSDLRNPANGADYLVIAHGSLITEIMPLVNLRAEHIDRVQVIDVQQIYDEFSDGWLDPKAIHEFVKYAYANWSAPAPTYLLLVGDGHYDPLNFYGASEAQMIPPYLDDVDLWIGETATDNRYGMVSGSDPLPDLYVGRLPVRSPAELNATVTKILAYEAAPQAAWQTQVMFVADNPDGAGDFHYFSDQIADNYLPPPYSAEKIYYPASLPSAVSYSYAITTGINSGRLLVSYIGHSGTQYWAGSPVLLHRKMLAKLTNADKLPVMLPMTCLDGYFIWPMLPGGQDFSSIGEWIVRMPNGGAVASFSPTGFGVAHGHDYMERGFFLALFNDYVDELGPAITQSKYYLYNQTGGSFVDLVETYALFGDPALRLPLQRPAVTLSKTVLPISAAPLYQPQVGYRLAFSNTGSGQGTHVVLSDLLPSWAITGSFTYTLNNAYPGASVIRRPADSFVWDVSNLAPGASGVITLLLQVDPAYVGVLDNTASITLTGEVGPQFDNTASASTSLFHLRLPLISK